MILVKNKWFPFGNYKAQINAEMFGIYKSQVDADFGLYKSTRDSFDITNARVGELENK